MRKCSKFEFRAVSTHALLIVLCARIIDRNKVAKETTNKIHGVEVCFRRLCVPSRISRFFFIHYSRNSNPAGKKKKRKGIAVNVGRKILMKEKKIHGVQVGFHCFCLPSRISSFFFAFINIILEILTGH